MSREVEEMGADMMEHGVSGKLSAKLDLLKALHNMLDTGNHKQEFKQKLDLLFHDVSRSCDEYVNLNCVGSSVLFVKYYGCERE